MGKSDLPKSIGVLAVGQPVVIDKGVKTKDTLAIVPEQAAEYVRSMIGKNIGDNHFLYRADGTKYRALNHESASQAVRTGTVRSAWVSPDGHIMAHIRVFDDNEPGREIIRKIKNREFTGCSLGSLHWAPNGVKEQSSCMEFTFCKQGAIPGSEILVTTASADADEEVVEQKVHVKAMLPDGSQIDHDGYFVGEPYMLAVFASENLEMSDTSSTAENKPPSTPAPTGSPATNSTPSPPEPPVDWEKRAREAEAAAAAARAEATKYQQEAKAEMQAKQSLQAKEAERVRQETMKKIETEALPLMKDAVAFLGEIQDRTQHEEMMLSRLNECISKPETLIDEDAYMNIMVSVTPLVRAAKLKAAEPAAQMGVTQTSLPVHSSHGDGTGFTAQEMRYQQLRREKEQIEKQLARVQQERDENEQMARAAADQLAAGKKRGFSWVASTPSATQPVAPAHVPAQTTVPVHASANDDLCDTPYVTDPLLAVSLIAAGRGQFQAEHVNNGFIPVHSTADMSAGKPAPKGVPIHEFLSDENKRQKVAKDWASDYWKQNGFKYEAPWVSAEEAKQHNARRVYNMGSMRYTNPNAPSWDQQVEADKHGEVC